MKYILTKKQLNLLIEGDNIKSILPERIFESLKDKIKSRAPEQEKQREEYINQILKKQITDITYQEYLVLQEEKKDIIDKFADYLKEKYNLKEIKRVLLYGFNEPDLIFFNILFKINIGKHKVHFNFQNLDDSDSLMFTIYFNNSFTDFSSKIQSSKYPFKKIEQLIKLQINKLKNKENLNEYEINEYEISPGESVEWDLENNTTKINRLDGSIEWILQNEKQTLPYLQKLFKTLNKEQIIEFSKRLYNRLSSSGNKRKIILIGLITAMINYGISKDDIIHNFNDSDIEQIINKEIKPIIEPKIEKEYRGDINNFLELLAFKESSGNWKKIRYSKKTGNPVYIGKYQFGKIALEDLGINPEIIQQFKDNPNIFPPDMQDNLVKRLIKKNRKYLGDKYLSYDGKIIGGVKVTESGLLAASHLRGALAVKKFIDSNGKIDLSDANGTKVSDYMKLFAGFKLF